MIKNLVFATMITVGMGGIAQACDAVNCTHATQSVTQSYQHVNVVSPQIVQYAPTAVVTQDACDNHAVNATVVTSYQATPVVVQQPVVVGNAYVHGTQRFVASQHVANANVYAGRSFVTGNAHVNHGFSNSFSHHVVNNNVVRSNVHHSNTVRSNVRSHSNSSNRSRGGILGNLFGGRNVNRSFTFSRSVSKSR